MSKGLEAAKDVAALLKARNPVIWIKSTEEARVEGLLVEAAIAAKFAPHTWDCAAGPCEMDGQTTKDPDGKDYGVAEASFDTMLNAIRVRATSGKTPDLWIMRDAPVWLQPPIGITAMRQLRNLARLLPTIPTSSAQAIVILTPSGTIPDELTNHVTVIDWPLPDREEISDALKAVLTSGLKTEESRAAAAPNGVYDAAVDAAVGLTQEEAKSCYCKSLVQHKGKIVPATVNAEKKRVITRAGVLEWIDPIPGGLNAVGGLDNLKTWLVTRAKAFSAAARAYGLPASKGCLLGGVPGCGKSLTAKAIAAAWGIPLLRMDMGALKSKFVGDSEGNLRKALRVVDAVGRSVLWIDEIEKALAGAVDGAADGGVSMDALGTILTWMEEKTSDTFVIATANDVSKLPSELLRRFDKIWFIDLPNEEERASVLSAALRFHKRDKLKIDAAAIAAVTDRFTGSEVARLVTDALFVGFADGERDITTEDLLALAVKVDPVFKNQSERLTKIQQWGTQNATQATPTVMKAKVTAQKGGGRLLDLDD